jgi:uncharacterized protein involved in exopolysaccharide biosynthesis
MTENQDITKKTTDDEIDLIEVFKKIWEQKKVIYKSVAICFLLAIVIIIGSPKEYKSEVILMEESSSKSGGLSSLLSNFGGLAGLSGLDNSVTSSEMLSPDLYPDIVKSTPFLLEVMNQKITVSKNDSVISVIDYFDRYSKPSFGQKLMKYSVGLPGTIMEWIHGNKPEEPKKPYYPFHLTRKQGKAAGELSKRIKVKEGESANTLVISVEMQDPVVAAQLTDSVVKCLTKYSIDYKTQKTKTDLDFVEKQYLEAKDKYLSAQRALAYYQDQNKNVILASTKAEEARLTSEFNMASSIYTSIAQQLEQAKMKVQESTPVFKVIEPAKLSTNKSSPQPSVVFIALSIIGLAVSCLIITLQLLYKSSK